MAETTKQPGKSPTIAKKGGNPVKQNTQKPVKDSVAKSKKSSPDDLSKKQKPTRTKAIPTQKSGEKSKLGKTLERALRPEGKSSQRLKVIPLGGMNEIGKNMTVFEYGDDIIIIDCGMTFPDDELLGVDLVIPDTTYLVNNKDKIKGIFLTHGHEDHIGALPYVLREINVPIYCTALTAGLINIRLKEHRNLKKVKLHVKKDGDHVRAGVFDVEFIRVNHSIADACALAIKTPLGMCLHTGDFKIDSTPIDGEMINLERFGQLGRQGVLLLMADSTNAERPGISMSERKVGDSFEREFKGCEKRIIVASFASNVHRIQQIIDVSVRHGRKVCVSGRSMENILKVGTELGYIKPPPGTIVELNQIRNYPQNKLTVITTGSQGEPMSALYRMAFSGHRQIEVGEGDKILIAASPIPGNEKSVYNMINELFRRGAEVVYERLADIHVSGHAYQEELKIMLSLIKPRYYLPAHGEHRHLMVNAQLGKICGVAPNNIFMSEVGKVLEIGKNSAGFTGIVPSGRVLIDGYGVGDVGTAVLRERKKLGEDGILTVVLAVDMKNRKLLSDVRVTTHGFVFVREAEEILDELKKMAAASIEACFDKRMTSRAAIKDVICSRLSDHLYKKTKRSPVVDSVLIEV